VRVAVHRAARRALGNVPAPTAWLLPARDLLSIVLWAGAFMGRTVRWGPYRYLVDRLGKLARLT
jgi:hypothetical protein